MSDSTLEALRLFGAQLDALIDSVAHPDERRIAHGNLRSEMSDWHDGNGKVTNIALVYETPGGSTAQLNLSFSHESGEFTYLGDDLREPVVTTEPEAALQRVAREVRAIPARREERLKASVTLWHKEGREVIAELNKLLQSEFLGGRITIRELQLGLRHATEVRRASSADTEPAEE